VAADGSLFRCFHRDEIIWPDRVEMAWAPCRSAASSPPWRAPLEPIVLACGGKAP